ncbi:unnamed protein product [Miscanthus lutarioriparius]|uniref:Uncharacterized protein n=1 Tax=Miscanthus lutarioriparius TaxID=422564 RepID=A0A811QYL5_9POAL|nr:unnamed protein product [Miscanthus lutarioriparius]
MPRSDRMTGAIKHKPVLLLVVVVGLGAAAISVATAAHVDSFSYPAFDATTTQDLVAGSNTSVLTSASHLFDHDGAFAEFNRTEGFLLLSHTVDVWRSGPGGRPALVASFNTSFALSGAAPVAFVVLCLQDSFANPAFGLNVTVIPNGTAAPGAGARPATALLDKRIVGLAGQRTTGKAMVGFFASTIQGILVGVRDWNLTVDRFDSSKGDGRNKGTSWWMILLAVLGVSGSHGLSLT